MAGHFVQNRIDITSWVNLSPVTVCFWFNLDSPLKNPERLVGSDDNWEIRVTTDWTPGSYRITNELFASSIIQPPTLSTTVPVAGTWYFVAASATQNVSAALYVNGLLEATGLCTDTATSTTFSIGGRGSSLVLESMNGFLDDVRIYDRILTADEIATIYACKGSDRIITGLVNRWLMLEGAEGVVMSGTGSIKDIVGSKHGTPNGSPIYEGSFLKTKTMTTWQ